jgi:hypothetical protein
MDVAQAAGMGAQRDSSDPKIWAAEPGDAQSHAFADVKVR